jgi:acyl carrier protein
MTNKQQDVLQIIKLVCEGKSGPVLVAKRIAKNTHLRNDLQLDSLELAELTVRIEDKFQIDIFEDGIVETVGEIFKKLSV